MHGILMILVVLVIVGLFLWALQVIPMDEKIRQIVRVVAIVAAVIWVLTQVIGGSLFGFLR